MNLPVRPAPRLRLRALVTAAWQAQCIHAAADLDLPAHLARSPATSAELATACGADEPALRRLLRALTAIGIVQPASDDPHRYALTPLGQALRDLGPWAQHSCSDPSWSAWTALGHAVRTGHSAFTHVHGMTTWQYHAAHPEDGERFQASMAAITAGVTAAITNRYDFGQFPVIADVGGGTGALLAEILTCHPQTRGVLVDLPPVIDQARPLLAKAGVLDRCDLQRGDFTAHLPAADAYLLKSVLHDWDDDTAVTILGRCRQANPRAKLIIVERVLPNRATANDLEAILSDLTMLVMLGGMERSAAEYQQLLADADFHPGRIIPTGTEFSIIEASA